jgi:hypothetical protein
MQTRWPQQVAAGGDGAVSEQPPAGRWWWAGLAVGGAIGGLGLAGLLADADKTIPVRVVWLVSLLMAHDLLLEPVVHLAGGWVRRVSQARRWPLQIGPFGSAVLALASVVALVWTGVLALAAVRHLCARGWTVRIRAP